MTYLTMRCALGALEDAYAVTHGRWPEGTVLFRHFEHGLCILSPDGTKAPWHPHLRDLQDNDWHPVPSPNSLHWDPIRAAKETP